MVHADAAIAGVAQRGVDHLRQQQLFLGLGQAQPVDSALTGEALGQMGVVVAGDAVGAQADDPAQRFRHALVVLVRQAVDEVETQRAETVAAHRLDAIRDVGIRVPAVDRRLHPRVEILNAQTDTVETHAFEQRDGGGIDAARVDLNGVLAVVFVEQFEVARKAVHQLGDLAVVEIGGGASAPVQLRDRPLGADQFALQRQLCADLL